MAPAVLGAVYSTTVKVSYRGLFLGTALVVFSASVVLGTVFWKYFLVLAMPVGVLVFVATASWLSARGDTHTQLPFYLAYAANALFWAVVVTSVCWAIRAALRLMRARRPGSRR